MIQLCHQIIHYNLGKTYYEKWVLVRKSKQSITKSSKRKLKLDRPITNISPLSSEKACKYEFLTGKDVCLEKDFLGKAATLKRIKY